MFNACPLQALAHSFIGNIPSDPRYYFDCSLLRVNAFKLFGSEKFKKLFTHECLSMGVATKLGNFIGGNN